MSNFIASSVLVAMRHTTAMSNPERQRSMLAAEQIPGYFKERTTQRTTVCAVTLNM